MIDSGWLSWFNFTKCFVYRIVCAVGAGGEGWVGGSERVGLPTVLALCLGKLFFI